MVEESDLKIKKIAVTGINGFVGTALRECLIQQSIEPVGVARDSLTSETIPPDLQGCISFVHLAARVHQPEVTQKNLYFEDNVKLTLQALKFAKSAGIMHFVFASTIKVYSDRLQKMDLNSECAPETPYGESKLLAEREAISFCKEHKISLDIVRIPLVVGSSAKGNLRLVRIFSKFKLPLPLGSIRNERSYVRLETLVEHIRRLSVAGNASHHIRIYNLCETPPVTSGGLLKIYLQALKIQIKIIRFPVFLVKFALLVFDLLRLNPQARSANKLLSSSIMVPGCKELQ